MKPGTMIQKANLNGWDITFRLPRISDLEMLRLFINELSQERTFIRFQGEEVSVKEEKEYLQGQLDKIEQNKALVILALHKGEIVGSADVSLGEKTERHIGVFGIVVKKEYRDKGLGTYLMKLILEQAQEQLPGLEIVRLGVQAPNQRAVHLYQNLGFKQYGLLPNGTKLEDGYRDQVLMYRQLEQK